VASDAADTDFTAKLIDILPNGEARNLTDGILRMRYRNGLERPAPPMRGDEIYPISIHAGVTSNLFRAGHRIAVEISSSNFPKYNRNPNTGRPIADETTMRRARQRVLFGKTHPSHLLLPVVPPTRRSGA
jgi:putative CocE/NonD family hydrolase